MADDITAELARAARERAARESRNHDPRWHELVHGELEPHEQAALRAEAEAPDAPERARRAYQAFRPLGDDFRARMTATIGRQISKDRQPANRGLAEEGSSGDESAARDRAAPEPEPHSHDDGAPSSAGSVVASDSVAAAPANDNPSIHNGPSHPALKSARRRWAYVSALLAAMIALALAIPWLLGPHRQPLPRYELQFDGFVSELRTNIQLEPESTLRYLTGSDLELRLIPQPQMIDADPEAIDVEPEAIVYLVGRQGFEQLASSEQLKFDEVYGVLELAGRIGNEIRPPQGDFELWAVVGPRGALPSLDTLKVLRETGERSPPPGSAWQLLRKRISFSSDP